MDQYYVTPDGQIAALPRRSFFDRLTSGLYDASVEWRRPGGGQEARLARTQPLTSALNQFGSQKRDFDQQNALLGRRHEFEAGQNTLQRDNAWSIADFEAGRRMEAERLKREQATAQFEATHGLAKKAQDLREMERYDKIYNENRQIANELETSPLKLELLRAQIAEKIADAEAARELAAYRNSTSAIARQDVSPDAWRVYAAANPNFQQFTTNAPAGITHGMVKTAGDLRPGSAGNLGLNTDILQALGVAPQISTAPGMTNRVGRVSASSLNP